MKTKNTLFIISLFAMIFLGACENNDVSPPVISDFELGEGNSRIGYPGSDLHVEAGIVAEGKIDNITVEIHTEGEHEDKSADLLLQDDEWEFDSVYTEFSGLKNATFHKHIEIPSDAPVGDYHFHFNVSDMEGNLTETEEELELRQP